MTRSTPRPCKLKGCRFPGCHGTAGIRQGGAGKESFCRGVHLFGFNVSPLLCESMRRSVYATFTRKDCALPLRVALWWHMRCCSALKCCKIAQREREDSLTLFIYFLPSQHGARLKISFGAAFSPFADDLQSATRALFHPSFTSVNMGKRQRLCFKSCLQC